MMTNDMYDYRKGAGTHRRALGLLHGARPPRVLERRTQLKMKPAYPGLESQVQAGTWRVKWWNRPPRTGAVS